jgi:GalNAc-alpha-(1->4)-GalNAc-alpha-(1->3)-diNAcBac-PP-undecaprenol alpha-1,4-N-acetyl-D-galactosaminyltransferase
LEQLRGNLGLSDCIKLKGWVDEPFCDGPPASLFVLPSRYEGFPNALLEAMAKGLPVVAFDCPGGIREIVEHGINGLLVPRGDVQELANALNRLMSDVAARRRLGARAKEVTTRFSVDKVMAKWDDLVNEVTTV